MDKHEIFKRFDAQPEYLKKWVMGISEACYFHVIMEGKYYAIVQRDGHSWYRGAYGGCTAYSPVEYTLISKATKNYWYDRGKRIESIKGRLNASKRKWLLDLLTNTDNGYTKGL